MWSTREAWERILNVTIAQAAKNMKKPKSDIERAIEIDPGHPASAEAEALERRIAARDEPPVSNFTS
jgi:hypothetical protein